MEAVKSFNSELSSLYEVKPPISKAKMTALTRGAIKAIKFYKHVVQSVEKFILKCKPEYKVPGLYVIDSIVRQSRHQFGPEKDVFAPRFAKSLQQTFVNLFKCPPEDKSKIIRVLNLWQKNQVFPAEVIQPLFDFADPNNPIHQQIQQQSTPVQQTNGTAASAQQQVVKGSPALQRTPTKANQSTASEAPTPNLSLTEPVLQQLQQLQRLLTKGTDTARPEQVHFDKKLLDFDYDDDEEEVNPSPRPPPQPSATDSVASLLTNPEVLRQLQTLQNTLAGAVHAPSQQDADAEKLKKLQEMKMQEDEFDKHLAQTVPNLPFASECEFKPSQTSTMIGGLHFIPPPVDGSQMSQNYMPQLDNAGYGGNQNSSGNDVEVITLDQDDSHSPSGDRYKRKRSRSRSRDKGRDRRRRSRSRSRSRRYRSRSKDRKEKDKKDKEKETERDKERKKRGLPIIKKDNLTVCSTTLWVGHLSKLVHQDDLSNTFGEFGEIVSIDLISPRGCAFIVMHRRQDAARCLTKLKNYNLHGKAITLAWAPGKGVKGKELKDYWEGDLGVSYIPWSKLKEDMDLEALEDGGTIDEDTMPSWMREKMEEMNKKKVVNTSEKPPFLMGVGDVPNQSTIDTSQPPPLPPSNLLQPPILPMVNPFQLNNRFLSMIPNMSSLPNMSNLPNLPIGVPPPNMPPSMMPNLGLGLGSPFQGPPGFMPSLPPPQETKPAPPPTTDSKLRNLSESLMNLAGQPLTMPPHPPMSQLSMTQPPMTQPPMTQPPPPIHTQSTDDNMDVEMEDAEHGNNKPNIPLSEQLQASMNVGFNRDNRRDEGRFSPGRRDSRDNRDNRRDDRSSDRSRRRSKSRDRDQNRPPKEHFSPRPPKEPFSPRDRDRIDRGGGRINSRDRDRRDRDRDGRENRDRDFGRGRDRDSRDRRAGDRERGNRWGPPDRRDERRDGPYDRRGGPPDRRDGPPNRRDGPPDRRDGPPDRRDGLQSRRDGMQDRRDSSDSRDRNDREKTLNERLKEMAGMKFDEPDDRSSKDRRPSGDGTRDDAQSQSEEFQTRTGESSKVVIEESRGDASQANRRRDDDDDPDFRSPQIKEFRNASPPELRTPPGQEERPDFSLPPPPIGEIQSDYRTSPRVEPPTEKQIQENFATSMEGSFGPDGASSFGPNDSEGPGQFGPPGAPGIFGSDNTNSFGPDGPGPFGPDGPGSFGPDGPGLFGPDGPGPFGPDGPDSYGPNSRGPFGSGRFSPDGPGRFGPDGPPYMEQGPPFGDDGYGPPPDMMDGPPGFGGPGFGPDFGPPGFNGPPDRFMRGGRRGRQRGGRRGGRDGPPDFFPPRDDFGPPMIDEFGPRMRGDDFGPPMRDDDFGPPMRDDFGPPMRDDFGPPMRDDFGPPMRDDDFGPPFGPRGRGRRGRGFFGPRGRGGEHGAPPFRDGPPGGFAPDFNGPPEFFRGGPRGGPRFSEPFPRGRGGRFRGGRGRPGPDFFDGPSGDFFGPPGGPPFEGGPPFDGPFEGGPPPDFDAGPFEGGAPPFESRRGRGRKNRSSRWASNDGGDAPEHIEGPPGDEFINQEASVIGGGEGGGTPLRDEINDSGPPLEDFAGPQDFPEESHPQQEQDAQDGGNDVAEQGDEAPPAE